MRIGTRVFTSINIKSLVFGSVIIFACLAFIFTGFGSLRPGSMGNMPPTTAAMVNSIPIEMSEFVNYMNEQGLGNVSGPEKKYVALQVIKQLVNQKILANEALAVGWQVSDNEIASAIKTVPVFQDSSTHQFSLSLFKNYLANQQTSEIDFYNYLRTQLNIQKMQNLIFMPIVISNSVAKLQYEINNTEFNLQYAVLSIPEKNIFSKIEDQAKKFVDDKTNLKQLQNLYANKKDTFSQKAQTKVRSILIAYKEASRAQGDALTRSKEEALVLMQKTLTRIQQGQNFSSAASILNDDNSAKQNQGDIGFVDDTKIDAVSMKSISLLTKQNNLSDIVDTPFGYRIFQFEDSKPAVNKSFDEVKLELAKQIVGNQIKATEESSFQNSLSQALAARNVMQINTLLTKNDISWKYASKLYKISDKSIVELGNANNLAENIFSLKKSGNIIPKMIDFGPKKVLIKLDSMNAPAEPTQADLDSLKKQMTTEQSKLFAQNTERFLSDLYEKQGKVQLNPIITQ